MGTPININNRVRVRLNDTGREIFRLEREQSNANMRNAGYKGILETHKKEEDGWSTWPLWELMQMFGPHISMGTPPPFDTTIELLPS